MQPLISKHYLIHPEGNILMRHIHIGLKGIYALLLCLMMTQAWAGPAKPAHPTLFEEIILEAGIENDLRQILGEHYQTFKNNFEMVANPAQLKDGGIFLDGWKTGQPDKQAAAFVYYPGQTGRVSAAYYDGRQIVHFGVQGSQIHPAIQIWAKRFLPPSKVISQARERAAPAPRSFIKPRAMSNEPSPQDQYKLRQVATSIWHPWIVSNWEMNAAVGDILATVTGEILKCSKPYVVVQAIYGLLFPYNKPEITWRVLNTFFKDIKNTMLEISQNQRYKSCIDTAAVNWRSPIEMASAGI
ncbi:hypothetical protein [Xylella taiwanensis]|nr:hypothetical protein [Xylella taiwanensis]EWS78670.1 hypothetical protein AF72_03650 [Xylella taiwanensis]MCD8456079.1 hypothetical protein [Xylella taiwanensis]MCD8463319.1 hypothetical protein [Xylella taiwanensis]MCD8465124.1 hypothetical protein [Xylella taiwanensis]MCD8467315.1 hypothetical protein [Xylella taiwanensis]